MMTMIARLHWVPLLLVALMLAVTRAGAQDLSRKYAELGDSLLRVGLRDPMAMEMLRELTSNAPHRLSGSDGAAKAVKIARGLMERMGFQNIHLEACMVPHWIRGSVESAEILGQKGTALNICALGGSIGTPNEGITAEVVEVHSFDELKRLGEEAKGKIVFFNRPLDPTKLNTFEGYGGAVDQRGGGAIWAGRVRGVAALVRSMSSALDDVPHTGSMSYEDTTKRVPGVAVSTIGADKLSRLLQADSHLKVRIRLDCRTLPDVPSSNVVGEITGTEKPEDVIVVGGHLDCWDEGAGAHDDGSGCVQAIEALNLIKHLGLKPKRTIRAVMFMNEENGLRGGKAYVVAPERRGEHQIAALESDRGGFAPRGFDVQADSAIFSRVSQWRELFDRYDAGRIRMGGSGSDISPLAQQKVPCFGLYVESHRYFDYHHSGNDTIDKVNPRELEMGAIVEALFCYVLSEEGLPTCTVDHRCSRHRSSTR